MKPRKLFPWLLFGFGVTAIVALTAVDYFSLRHNTFQGNAEWVRRVSDMVTAERLSLQRSIQHFPSASSDFLFERLPDINPSIVALLVEDMRTHARERWSEPN